MFENAAKKLWHLEQQDANGLSHLGSDSAAPTRRRKSVG
jgi:hypothetical protein